MQWEILTKARGTAIMSGRYTTSNSTALHMPVGMREQSATWHVDKKLKVAKLSLDKNGIYNIKNYASIPTAIRKLIEEKTLVVYCDKAEANVYVASYKEGSEKLALLIKREKLE